MKDLKQAKGVSTGGKICTTCGKRKKLNYFPCHKDAPDGHTSKCKPCTRIREAEYNLRVKAEVERVMAERSDEILSLCATEKALDEAYKRARRRSQPHLMERFKNRYMLVVNQIQSIFQESMEVEA
ncbi:hypothetical protein KAR91_11805 [Candidatus Pacearchaeota archaeon]|nr:hypothetical protein [Candidatus Pacearchaeota archaeon]